MLKTMRESFHHLKWTLFAVIIVFVLGFVFFSGGGGGTGGPPGFRGVDREAQKRQNAQAPRIPHLGHRVVALFQPCPPSSLTNSPISV